jgi:hypothetical protein
MVSLECAHMEQAGHTESLFYLSGPVVSHLYAVGLYTPQQQPAVVEVAKLSSHSVNLYRLYRAATAVALTPRLLDYSSHIQL